MKPFQVLLLVLIFSVPKKAEEIKYEIIRQLQGDRFRLPPMLCTTGWKQTCAEMGGTNTEANCTCRCTEGSKNVFGYFGNSWKCTSDHDVRRYYSGVNGCRYSGVNTY